MDADKLEILCGKLLEIQFNAIPEDKKAKYCPWCAIPTEPLGVCPHHGYLFPCSLRVCLNGHIVGREEEWIGLNELSVN